MTDASINAILVAIPVILGIIAKTILDIMTARTALVAAEKNANKIVEKVDKVIEGNVEIHTLANDQLSKMTNALAVANEKIQGLEKLIVAQKAIAPKET